MTVAALALEVHNTSVAASANVEAKVFIVFILVWVFWLVVVEFPCPFQSSVKKPEPSVSSLVRNDDFVNQFPSDMGAS